MLWAWPRPIPTSLARSSTPPAPRSPRAATRTSGRSPTRIRKAGGGAKALKQLERVLTVQRARARLAAPAHSAARPHRSRAAPRGRTAFRAQPTITGNMEVRRSRAEGGVLLGWDAAPAVTGWEVRFSERADARSEYVVRETLSLPGTATSVELALGELPRRVHLLGARTTDGSSGARSSPRSRRQLERPLAAARERLVSTSLS